MIKARIPALLFAAIITVAIALFAYNTAIQQSSEVKTSIDVSVSSSSMNSSAEDTVVTRNVSYIGVLDDLGAGIYMQGTHRLLLDDGQMIVLASSDNNLVLDTYLGKRVEVRGSVQPTVEGDGTMMSVSEIVVLSSSSSSEATASSESSATPASAESSESSSSSAVSSTVSSVEPIQESSSSSFASSDTSSLSSSTSSELEEQVQLMMKQTYDQSSLWTQKYCTSHIAFCIPVHKNWYFKSFGATTSNSWHVELGMATIDELGQGAITLNLVSGTSASVSASDGQIKDQGQDIIGYKDWNDGNHFEIIADVRLRAAITYMLSNISPYELAQ